MSFLYPSFLWALALIGIPILIHLFNFQRPKRLFFPNTRFLKEVIEQTNKSRKLKHWLILAFRCLAIVCLVLAFAQPILTKEGGNSSGSSGEKLVAIYLDNSFSMQQNAGNGTQLDKAIRAAERAIKQFPPSTRFHISTADFLFQGSWFITQEEAIKELRQIKFSNKFRDFNQVQQRFANAFSSEPEVNDKSTIIFSDFQTSTSGNLELIKKDSSVNYYLFANESADVSNIYIDSLWLNAPFMRPGEKNELNITLTNKGGKKLENIATKVFLNEIQIGANSHSFEPNESFTFPLSVDLKGANMAKGKILINDRPILFDNEYFFTLKAAPIIQVLAMDAPNNNALKNVFGNSNLFKLKSFTANSMDYEALKVANVIAIGSTEGVDENLMNNIINRVNEGASLLIFPSDNQSAQQAAEGLKKAGLGYLATENSLANLSNSADTNLASAYALEIPNTKNQFFKNVLVGTQPNFSNNFSKQLLTNLKGASLLNYRNGSPFLAKYNRGAGSIYLSAGPIGGNNSNFQTQLFLPFIYKASFLSISNYEKLSYRFQERNLTLNLNEEISQADKVFELKGTEASIIPPQRVVKNTLVIETPKGDVKTGYYDLTKDAKVYETLALNYSKEESDMNFYSEIELKKLTEGYPHIRAINSLNNESVTSDILSFEKGTPIWKYLLIAALAFIFTEILLIKFFKK